MKETESKAIKNMSSNYMYQNQLKEEKALLLASIEKDFNRNQWFPISFIIYARSKVDIQLEATF